MKRDSVADEIMLKIDAAEFQKVREEDIRRNEANFISSVQRELNTISGKVNELDTAFHNFPEPYPSTPFENTELLGNIFTAKNAKVTGHSVIECKSGGIALTKPNSLVNQVSTIHC